MTGRGRKVAWIEFLAPSGAVAGNSEKGVVSRLQDIASLAVKFYYLCVCEGVCVCVYVLVRTETG